MTLDRSTKTDRALRAAAWATLAAAAYSTWMLPVPLHRGEDGGWVVEYGILLNLVLLVTAAVLLWRGNRVAGALVGLHGLWRLGEMLVAIASIPTGSAPSGPAWLFAVLMALPVVVFWIRGGVAVVREWRHRRTAPAAG